MWELDHRCGSVPELLALDEPQPDRLVARIHTVSRPALVIGSSQDLSVVDQLRTNALGIDLVKRRSGGGAVFLAPSRQVWFDFFVPAGGPLWQDDVIKAAEWVGLLWASVAALFTDVKPVIHSGGLKADRWGKLVCFASIGPGEVLISGRKAIGVSQRRNRYRTHIQTSALVIPPEFSSTHEGSLSDARQPLQQPSAPSVRQSRQNVSASYSQAFSQEEFSTPDEFELLQLTPEERIRGRSVLAERCCVLNAEATTAVDSMLDALGEQHRGISL